MRCLNNWQSGRKTCTETEPLKYYPTTTKKVSVFLVWNISDSVNYSYSFLSGAVCQSYDIVKGTLPLPFSHTSIELAYWSFPCFPWGRLTTQLSERTEKPCNHGLVAVSLMEPTSIQILSLLTQHVDNLWMKYLKGLFFSQWIYSSGSIEWTQTVSQESVILWFYLKQTTVKCNCRNIESLCYSEQLDSSTAPSGICPVFESCRVEL